MEERGVRGARDRRLLIDELGGKGAEEGRLPLDVILHHELSQERQCLVGGGWGVGDRPLFLDYIFLNKKQTLMN